MRLSNKLIIYLHGHPVCLSALGIAPIIAPGKTLLSALTISLVFASTLLLSALSVSTIRNLVPHAYRLIFILPITSLWVTIADLLLQAYVYEMHVTLDMYIPLIAMNSLVLMLLEQQALTDSVSDVIKTVMHGVAALLVVTLVTGAIREILVRGDLLTDMTQLFGDVTMSVSPSALLTFPLFNSAAGGFIVVGCVIALINVAYLTVSKPGSDH